MPWLEKLIDAGPGFIREVFKILIEFWPVSLLVGGFIVLLVYLRYRRGSR